MKATIVGGGMITHDQLLPSLFQLQRLGLVEEIAVCARRDQTLQALLSSGVLREAFPDQSFRSHAGSYRETVTRMPARNLVLVALPDHLHFEAIMASLAADQHVIAVKPLVMKVAEAEAIEREAFERGLFVGIEYHKRFDDRSLLARRKYGAGELGEFRLGTAHLMEKWYYRHSNFQNWCTTGNSDAFTYIGCHYVDLVHFITGLAPVSVSVYGIEDRYPNGNHGLLWTDARIIWSNGACLNVQNSLGCPDQAPGTNTQGLTMYCSGQDRGAMLRHSDQYRGLEYVYLTTPASAGGTSYAEPSPDYFQYVDRGTGGLTPVGYGFRSIEYLLDCCMRVERAADRRAVLREIDAAGIAATPANSRHNEEVIEGARRSILNGGATISVGSRS